MYRFASLIALLVLLLAGCDSSPQPPASTSAPAELSAQPARTASAALAWEGQPGLWFIAGGLAQCRIGSKQLALQIKAIEEGLMPRLHAPVFETAE